MPNNNIKLLLQLHVHSNRSHDSSVSIKEYVDYLENHLKENEFAVLGITDHNVLPIKIKEDFPISRIILQNDYSLKVCSKGKDLVRIKNTSRDRCVVCPIKTSPTSNLLVQYKYRWEVDRK